MMAPVGEQVLTPPEWHQPLDANLYKVSSTWDWRYSFSLFRKCLFVLGTLGDLWTLQGPKFFGGAFWPQLAHTAPRRANVARRLLAFSVTVALSVCYVFSRSCQWLLFCGVVFATGPSFVLDIMSHLYFKLRALTDSFADFNANVCRGNVCTHWTIPPSIVHPRGSQAELRDQQANEWLTQPWHADSRAIDLLVSGLIWVLDICSIWSPKSSLRWRPSSFDVHHQHFRRYLRQQPMAMPVACHDYPYLQDTSDNPCHIMMLAVTQRISGQEARSHFMRRWVMKYAKLRAVVAVRHGRLCWLPLRVSRRLEARLLEDEEETVPIERRVFHIADHLFEAPLDLREQSIYSALSQMASVCLRRDRPLWRLCVFQPINADVAVRVRKGRDGDVMEAATSVSFLAMQIHHALGDGVGLGHMFVNCLFDREAEDLSPSSCCSSRVIKTRIMSTTLKDAGDFQPEQPPRSWFLVTAFYLYHFCRSLTIAAGQMWFWLFWVAPPPALFQNLPPGQTPDAWLSRFRVQAQNLRPRSPVTGRKFLTAPMLFDTTEVLRLCRDVHKLVRVKPTLNDVFCACVSSAIGRLRGGEVAEELRKQLRVKIAAQKNGELKENLHNNLQLMCAAREGTDDSPSTLPRSRTVTGLPLGRELTASAFPAFVQPPPQINAGLAAYHRYASDFQNYMQIMIPMTTRTSMSTDIDNFTSLVLTRLPLPSATRKQMQREQTDSMSSLLVRFLAADAQVGVRDLLKCALQHPKEEADDEQPPEEFDQLHLQLRQLLAVKGEMDWLKNMNARTIFFTIVCAMFKAFPDGMLRWFINQFNNNQQLFFTNVMGPSVRCSIAGRTVLSLQSWPPVRGNVTLALKLLSYGDDLQLLVTADECEAASFFSEEELKHLTRQDLMSVVSVIGELVWDEYQRLRESIADALQQQEQTSQ